MVKGWQSDKNAQFFAGQIDELTDLLDRAGIPFGFVVFPELNDLKHPDEFGGPRKTVLGLLKQRNSQYCDPYDAFEADAIANKRAVESLFLDRDSIHYSPAGHQVLCAAIERCIDETDLAGLATTHSP